MKDIKKIVKEKYGEIVERSDSNNPSSCCDSFCVGGEETAVFSDDYSKLKGYQKDADLNLGCGLPTEFAKIKKGDTVVDLGSGAGNDCFVARAEAGETGKVIGIDFTEAMLEKARRNADKLGFTNMEFLYGDIEEIPLPDNTADVVVSNCVLNLVPDKQKAFAETHRILKPGGHFSISDVVTEETLPEGLQKAAEMYAGCVAGAMRVEQYLDVIRAAGFQNITIQKKKPVVLPTELLTQYLSGEELETFMQKQGIYSITLYGEKG